MPLCAAIEPKECDGCPNEPSCRASSECLGDATDLSRACESECAWAWACECVSVDECGRARCESEKGYCALRLFSVSSMALFVEGEVAVDVAADLEVVVVVVLQLVVARVGGNAESSSIADWMVEEADGRSCPRSSLEFERLDIPDHHAQRLSGDGSDESNIQRTRKVGNRKALTVRAQALM